MQPAAPHHQVQGALKTQRVHLKLPVTHLRSASSTIVWLERPAGLAPSPTTEDQEEEVKRNNRCTLRTQEIKDSTPESPGKF